MLFPMPHLLLIHLFAVFMLSQLDRKLPLLWRMYSLLGSIAAFPKENCPWR